MNEMGGKEREEEKKKIIEKEWRKDKIYKCNNNCICVWWCRVIYFIIYEQLDVFYSSSIFISKIL